MTDVAGRIDQKHEHPQTAVDEQIEGRSNRSGAQRTRTEDLQQIRSKIS